MTNPFDNQPDETEDPIELPTAFKNRSGSLQVSRGAIGEGEDRINLYAWDATPRCTNEDCPATRMCHYQREGRCRVASNYMQAATSVIIRNFANELDEPRLYQVGMHLLPLYRMLCKLKIEEVGVERAVSVGRYGPKANPIYKEIRETIKLLLHAWKSLGLDTSKGVEPAQRGSSILDIGEEEGTYYERMEKDAKNNRMHKHKKIRLQRRKEKE